jgi:hypothetical protein
MIGGCAGIRRNYLVNPSAIVVFIGRGVVIGVGDSGQIVVGIVAIARRDRAGLYNSYKPI